MGKAAASGGGGSGGSGVQAAWASAFPDRISAVISFSVLGEPINYMIMPVTPNNDAVIPPTNGYRLIGIRSDGTIETGLYLQEWNGMYGVSELWGATAYSSSYIDGTFTITAVDAIFGGDVLYYMFYTY